MSRRRQAVSGHVISNVFCSRMVDTANVSLSGRVMFLCSIFRSLLFGLSIGSKKT